MEITIRHRRLMVVACAAITCMLLWSFAASSAQVAGTVDLSPPASGFGAAEVSPDLLRTPRSIPAAGGESLTQIDPFEPDDTIDQAKKIVIYTPQVHYFQVPGDVDWVKFWAWAGVEYTIETFDLSPINDTKLWLYDADGTLLTQNDDGDNPPASTILWTAPARGTYFIKMAHPKFQGGDGFSYSIRITDSDDPCGEGFEPDNIMDEAKSIDVDGISQEHTFHGSCGGDVDWVKFDAITGTVYTIKTFSLSGGNDTILGLYDADGITVTVNGDEMVNDDDPENPPASRIDWMADKGGTYYVKVRPFNRYAGGCDLSYRLKVETSLDTPTPTPPPGECADEFEPDDIPGGAKPIVVNGDLQRDRTFHVEGDEDWVKFWAFAGNEYTIQTLDLSPGNDTVLCLYDAEIRELECNDDIDYPDNLASRIIWRASASGTYFAKVRHHSPHVGGCGFSYSLVVTSSVLCEDAYEEDDTLDQAQPITVDGLSQSHNFHVPCICQGERAPDEADWVKFNAVKGYTYRIRTFDLEGNNDTVLGLYDADGVTVTVNSDEVVNDDYADDIPASEIVWKAPVDGVYYVKVSPFEATVGGCDVSYRLEVATVPFYCYLPVIFKPLPNNPPNTPSTPSPSDGATGQQIDVDLSWSGGDPDSDDTVTYDVYFGSDSPPPLKETIGPYPATQASITYDPGTLDYSTQYNWYIVAHDSHDAESRGPEEGWWSFTTCTCNDEHEPDNDQYQCLDWPALESGEPIAGYICEEHIHLEDSQQVERDWYHFELTLDDWNQGLREIEVDLEVPDTVDYDLFLWVGDHWEGSENTEPGADEHIEWSAQGIGTYYIVVKSLGDYDNCNPYSLQVTLNQSQGASRILHQFWRRGLWGSPSYNRLPQP